MQLERIQRLKNLDSKPNYVKWMKKDLMRATECRFLKPQRMLSLTWEEERLRCQCTWQQYDRFLREVAFGDHEVLQHRVVDVKGFMRRRQQCVLGFSDQVPWWGMVSHAKQLYMKSEFESKCTGGKHQRALQKRGVDADRSMKFRITVELRQIIVNYFDPSRAPEGMFSPTLLIVGGNHCRLDNISLSGRWLQAERFKVGAVEVVRPEGGPVGNLMQGWRQLRETHPEMFDNIQVMQQPFAVIDSVLMSWVLEEQGSGDGEFTPPPLGRFKFSRLISAANRR